ncbi:hypothetical protein Ddye_005373 [Dipteronia dyeriana]|uniref:Uncharacterized protein n=1 Tax=Dipteronia dyeriana TaxID=168575 RepID=A0AAE0CPK3_9ROSI|nr:hypothetical protein Ddye_005373 [Dipteronia dyeriana]
MKLITKGWSALKEADRNAYVQSDQQAFYYIEKAVDQLHPGAIYLLGAVYLTCDCVKKYTSSVLWCFHRATEKGHSGAAIAYGSLILRGTQVPESLTKFNAKHSTLAKRARVNEDTYLEVSTVRLNRSKPNRNRPLETETEIEIVGYKTGWKPDLDGSVTNRTEQFGFRKPNQKLLVPKAPYSGYGYSYGYGSVFPRNRNRTETEPWTPLDLLIKLRRISLSLLDLAVLASSTPPAHRHERRHQLTSGLSQSQNTTAHSLELDLAFRVSLTPPPIAINAINAINELSQLESHSHGLIIIRATNEEKPHTAIFDKTIYVQSRILLVME